MYNKEFNIPLLVLAGGFGTRLRSVVSDVPKPLAPIGNLPFLYYQIKNWRAQGQNTFIFLLHNQANLIIDFLTSEANGLLESCDVKYVIEPTPLGTGGAVAYSIDYLNIKTSFLVTNADTWLGTGVAEVLNCSGPAMAVVRVDDAGRYGSVDIVDGYIDSFHEKSQNCSSAWINAGLCKLDPVIFANWNKKPFSLEQEIFPKLALARQLEAVKLETDFIDIGIPSDYNKFKSFIKII
jgi:D-glycero-alpha-D-manno-heptose 1-phosphate guanylyltransferase